MNKFLKAVTVLSVFAVTACSSIGDSSNPSINVLSPSIETVDQITQFERDALATNVFYFKFDSSELSDTDRNILTHRAAKLKTSPDSKIRLEGHASEEGTREYNLALGERRANEIAMFLIVNGVTRNQIEVVSYGEEMPANTGSSENDRSKNRRVEIKQVS